MSDLFFKELYKKALRFLGVRLRSEKEMRDKINEWIKKDSRDYGKVGLQNFGEEEDVQGSLRDEVERVIAQLKKDRFIDDRRFAEEWVSSRVRNKPRGEVILRMELVQKGIDRHLAEDVLDQILRNQSPDDSDINTLKSMAAKIGNKYIRKFVNEDDRAFKFKMTQVLLRKGFDNSIIKSVVDELLVTRYNTRD